jgi:hypothetical protein
MYSRETWNIVGQHYIDSGVIQTADVFLDYVNFDFEQFVKQGIAYTNFYIDLSRDQEGSDGNGRGSGCSCEIFEL